MAIADAQNYMKWLVDTFRPYLRGRILEVGIGHGHYSAFLGECGQYLGVDLDEESVADEKHVGFDAAKSAVERVEERAAMLVVVVRMRVNEGDRSLGGDAA